MNMTMQPAKKPLLRLLTDAHSTMSRLFEYRARHLGLTRPQWLVLYGLNGNDGVTQSELSEQIFIARSPLGKIVDQLETKGFVERRSDPDDRRVNRLFLTDQAEPLIQPARDLAAELERCILDGLPEKAPLTVQLAHLTERLRSLMEQELQTA